MKYSIIDISSNSLSAIVASAEGDRTEIVFKERAAVSLVRYLGDGKLLPRGMDKLIETLTEIRENCRRIGAERCYLISTAAFRNVENFEEIYDKVLAATGLPVNALDGATEAYCDYVANVYYSSCEKPVLIDLGGKSMEICDLSETEKEKMLCLPFGLLDLYRKFIDAIYPDEGEAKKMKSYLTEKFDKAGLPGKDVYKTAVMVGATNAAMYDIYADYAGEKPADGVKVIRYKKFKKLVKHLIGGEDRSRYVLNNAPEKIYLIGSAAVVLKTLFKRFGVEQIIVSDRGVKEGYLQLILEGRAEGKYLDLQTGISGGSEQAAAPKKRGRKPRAAKIDDGAAMSASPKKRGRKPRAAKADDGAAMSAPPKKRGRKPRAALPVKEAAPAAEEPAEPAPMPEASAADGGEQN